MTTTNNSLENPNQPLINHKAENLSKKVIPNDKEVPKIVHLDVQRLSFKFKNRKNSFSKLKDETEINTENEIKTSGVQKRSNSLLTPSHRRSFIQSKEQNMKNLENLNSSCISFLSSQSEKHHVNINTTYYSLNNPQSTIFNKNRQSSIHKITNDSIGNCISSTTNSQIIVKANCSIEQVDFNQADKLSNDHYSNNSSSNNISNKNVMTVNKKLVYIEIKVEIEI